MFETAGIQEKLMTYEEYLDFEEKSEVKHEFANGKLIEMSGASFNHNFICSQLIKLLGLAFDKNEMDCYPLTSDQIVQIPSVGKSVYSDVAVVCGNPEFVAGNTRVITNPLLILEVLSKSTEKYDRTLKFDNYRTLPSLREYVLVSQDEPLVEAFYLHDPENDLWKISRAHGLDAPILLRSIDCTLALKDVYHRVKFESA
jgi:Uma2 family endonuclease